MPASMKSSFFHCLKGFRVLGWLYSKLEAGSKILYRCAVTDIIRCCNEKDVTINMQITNPVVCVTSKGRLNKQIKPPLVGENAFPLTGFFFARRLTLHLLTVVGYGQLPYPCNSQAKSRDDTSRRGGVM